MFSPLPPCPDDVPLGDVGDGAAGATSAVEADPSAGSTIMERCGRAVVPDMIVLVRWIVEEDAVSFDAAPDTAVVDDGPLEDVVVVVAAAWACLTAGGALLLVVGAADIDAIW